MTGQAEQADFEKEVPATNPQGAARPAPSRLQTRSSGIFGSSLTRYDDPELIGLYDELVDYLQPKGPIEEMLVDKTAQTYLRLQRCARAEAEWHIATWEGPVDLEGNKLLDLRQRAGLHASRFDPVKFAEAVKLFAYYDRTLTNQLVQLLNTIERLQRARLGESVPPPISGNLTIQLDERP